MVTTRQRNDSRTPTTNGTRGPQIEGENSDIIHIRNPLPKKRLHVPTTPTLPAATMDGTPSSTSGMEDLSLTSPSNGTAPIQDPLCTPKREQIPPAPDRTVSSALRRLVAKSRTTKGSAHNPIVLEEYSPRRKLTRLPKRKRLSQEPHMFQDRHRKLYTYRPPRTALAPKPANGSTFTGDKSNDLYRMMNAKMTAEGWTTPVPCGPPPVTYSNVGYGVPFDVQYPMSAQYLAQTPVATSQNHSSYAQYHAHIGVTLSGDSEDMLRMQAVQCIRHHSRPQPHKKMLSDGLDETSASDTERLASSKSGRTPYTHSQTSSTSTRTSKLHVYQDLNDHITPLITQTSLLTSLLQAYPCSNDQEGLREDIAMLVSVQNLCMNEWMKAESQLFRKRRRSNTDSAISVGSESLDMQRARKAMRGLDEVERRAREKDEEVRSFLSAGAGMWQDGSGVGVADVFAAHDDGMIDASVEKQVATTVRLDIRRKTGICGWEMVEC